MIPNLNSMKRAAFAAMTGLAVLLAPQMFAQQSAPAAPTGPLAPEKYKNIQVLTNVPADQIPITMTYISAAVGLPCNGCHVQDTTTGQLQPEKDDKRAKQTARTMMKMVLAINSGNFGIQAACATCHGGKNQPAGLPMAEMMTPEQISQMAAGDRGGQRGPGGPGGTPAGAPGGARGQQPAAPPVDDILNKYVDAIGGRAAVEKLQSVTLTGTLSNRMGQNNSFTIEEKANKYRESVQQQNGAMIRGFDGAAGWAQIGTRVQDLNGFNLDQALRLNDLNIPLHLKDKYSQLQASGRPFPINGSNAIAVTGRSGITSEQFFFDANSGLLVRRVIQTRTALGPLREQIDYGDYRNVGGVKIPFEIKRQNWNTLDIYKVSDAKANASISDSDFIKPKN